MDYFSLLKNGVNCVVIKNGKEIYSSCKMGIKPLLDLIDNHYSELQDAIIIDKIIGQAAAFILLESKIKKIYAKVISRGACELLSENGIEYEYSECTDNIRNRQNNGICPMEAAVCTILDRETAVSAIRKKVKELSTLKNDGRNNMAYLGEEIKKLGFGLMRLPMKDGKTDMEQTKQMVDLFMSKGFTYFDTAYVYGDGESERAAKDALVKRYPRESFQLATKLPVWDRNKSAEEVKQYFYTSLERTQAGYFDYYLLHNLGGDRTAISEELGMWDFVKQLKNEGLVRHFGFSFHDNAASLDRILTAHPEAEFVQLQINYADWEHPDIESRKCYEVARKHNKPVIIMEPVKGGSLATLTDECVSIFKDVNPELSIPSWAIRFAASLDGVITVLSGMSNMEQMTDNLSYMENFCRLSQKELDVVSKVRNIIENTVQIGCTNCEYCIKGCPKNISINRIFSALNYLDKFNDFSGAKWRYNEACKEAKACDCIGCKKCENVCPQHIKITECLARASEIFDK